ncbi:phage protein [Dickeya chrysanthemi]|uniref:phage protein n=1 Tax=Dickeya chrysanthemi TaxID=556 RepID=UPI000532F915
MSDIFGRTYNLQITTVDGTVVTCEPPTQIRFMITNMPENQVATAQITLYGISAEYRALMQRFDEQKQRYGTVKLSAGYDSSSGEIYSGQINSVEIGRDGVSVYIRLNCWSIDTWRDAVIGKTWGEKTPVADVLRDVAATFELPVEMIGDFSGLPAFQQGFTLAFTSSRDFLNSRQSEWGYSWYITTSRVTIVKSGASRAITHEISSENGMEGMPRWYQTDMEVDVRLDHTIQPGDIIKVSSDFWTISYSGMYQTGLNNKADRQRREGKFRVLATSHVGDYWGDLWTTTTRCLWDSQ